MDEAARLASGIPMAKLGSIEVRPIYHIEDHAMKNMSAWSISTKRIFEPMSKATSSGFINAMLDNDDALRAGRQLRLRQCASAAARGGLGQRARRQTVGHRRAFRRDQGASERLHRHRGPRSQRCDPACRQHPRRPPSARSRCVRSARSSAWTLAIDGSRRCMPARRRQPAGGDLSQPFAPRAGDADPAARRFRARRGSAARCLRGRRRAMAAATACRPIRSPGWYRPGASRRSTASAARRASTPR